MQFFFQYSEFYVPRWIINELIAKYSLEDRNNVKLGVTRKKTGI